MDNNSVLVVAAHPDDEAIGMGGTIAKFVEIGVPVHVVIMTDGAGKEHVRGTEKDRKPRKGAEIKAEAESPFAYAAWRNGHKAADMLGVASLTIHDLPDSRFDRRTILSMAKLVETHLERVKPGAVYTHHAGDLNLDHRMTHEAVAVACRPKPGHSVKSLYFFEVNSSTEWTPPGTFPAFLPTTYVDITSTIDKKEEVLREAYKAEMRESDHPRSIMGISGLNYWRGSTVGVRAAEAFVTGRVIFS